MTGWLNMDNNRIINCGKLTMNNDGDSQINMNNNMIKNCGGLNMSNNYILDCGQMTMSGTLYMNNNIIVDLPPTGGVGRPITPAFADNRYLMLEGIKSMIDNLNMGGNKIIKVGTFDDHKVDDD